MPEQACPNCRGEGVVEMPWIEPDPRTSARCWRCRGTGKVTAPAEDDTMYEVPASRLRELREKAVRADKLAGALREIRDHGKTHESPCYAITNGDCADMMQEIARAALDAYETEGRDG